MLTLSGCGSSNDDSVLDTERKTTATSTVNNFLSAILEGNVDKIETYMSNYSFIYVSETGEEINADQFLDNLDQGFSAGAIYYAIGIDNINSELITSSEVKVTGLLKTYGKYPDGRDFSDTNAVEFRVKNIRGAWLITKMKESS